MLNTVAREVCAFDTVVSRTNDQYPRTLAIRKGPVTAQLSQFARSLSVETAFTVLAVAKTLKGGRKGRR